MAILLEKNAAVLVQGLTGKEGQRAASWMRSYGTNVVAGVTPGKGGQEVDGVPVFNTVKEAVVSFPSISIASVYVPPRFVKSAVLEDIEAGIPTIHVIAEGVPVQDTAELIDMARKNGSRIIGPSSIGFISPGIGKVGSIGGDTNDQFESGSVGLISKSGGLSSEFCLLMTRHGIGQSTVIGIGGDQLIGATYADLFPLFETDVQTKAVVIIGEIGGSYEEEAADAIASGVLTKPVVAFISGLFAETLPQGVSFGHAGAIVDAQFGTRKGKVEALQKAGVRIAEKPEEILGILKKLNLHL